ncbi:MAG: GNAT family N-acetyltransferase [Actinomycetota bacterium]|nr:GNAT family N-acetyltransferase [Actinomycetota bacterium]
MTRRGVAAGYLVRADRPDAPEVRALLAIHLRWTRMISPPQDVHALAVEELLASRVAFVSIRCEGVLLGVGALKQLEPGHAEVKSMHTAEAARGRGVGRALLDHLVATARSTGIERLSLETGSMREFAPARTLYESAGFRRCPPFGDYVDSPNSVYLTLVL